jgi:hypothetical protein
METTQSGLSAQSSSSQSVSPSKSSSVSLLHSVSAGGMMGNIMQS